MRVNPQYEETPKDTFRKLIERQVKEILSEPGAAIFEPFFREKHVSDEIMRRLTMPQIHRWRGVYKKHGCWRCETHDMPHVGCGMCAPCNHVVRERLKAAERREAVEPWRAHELAGQHMLPAVMAVAEPEAFPSRGPTYEGRFTQAQAAEAAGTNVKNLGRWLSEGLFEPPQTKLSETRWLWTHEDVERLKEFAVRKRDSLRAKPRLPRNGVGKMGRPRKADTSEVRPKVTV
jgi:MerR HTH family regulatory protein